jgi:hypothetical protein
MHTELSGQPSLEGRCNLADHEILWRWVGGKDVQPAVMQLNDNDLGSGMAASRQAPK